MKSQSSILRVVIFALLIDLLAFTIILPLFPRLLKHYESTDGNNENTLYYYLTTLVRKLRVVIAGNEDRLDIIMFGGFLGSLYSFLQFISAPIIGKSSDIYGRRFVLLVSMIGNAISMLLWIFADSFEIFLVSRIVGGLTEGNVQMSIAMISDISDSTNRSKTLALVGICFAVGFTLGPPLGAYMTNINLKEYFPTLPINSYSSPALFAFILIIIETIYLLVALPETLNFKKETNEKSNRLDSNTNPQSLTHLSIIHFLFLFVFSGMEFTLTFLTYDRFQFSNTEQGKLLAFFGILTAIVQGGYVRRVSGILSCGIGLLIIGLLAKTELIYLYLGSAFMAFTSGTVVTSLTSLVSLADHQKQGETLGYFRSAGQLGRCLGPMVACSGYWVLGSTQLYTVSGIWMVVLAGISWLIVPSKFVKGFKQD